MPQVYRLGSALIDTKRSDEPSIHRSALVHSGHERAGGLPEACPICTMTDLMHGEDHFECATCGHEWAPAEQEPGEREVRDANGNLLANGDTISLVQGVSLNGKANAIKAGTKIKGIRLISGDHEINCKVDGRAIILKAQFVKKA